jgi:putative ABC transport system ATP-binding protein
MKSEGLEDREISKGDLLRETIARLRLFLRLERKLLGILASYALAIGVFSLIVPLTVQELVNTFVYAIQPIMIVTLSGIMAMTLVFIGAFRVLQLRLVEILAQRIFARIAFAMTEHLPRVRDESFLTKYANYFSEAELLPRALLAMLVDIINVVVGGSIGMAILVLYHPYFLGFNVLLVGGFVLLVTVFGQGALRITLAVSQRNYDTLNWVQDIAHNLLHFKATTSKELLLKKTDELVSSYVAARKVRSDILAGRQYKASVLWQAFGHGGLIAMAGWLLSTGQITLGQFVASEVIVGTLLLNLDTVVKRMPYAYFVFTSLSELAKVLSLPQDTQSGKLSVPLPDPTLHGVRLTCKDLSYAYPNSRPVFEHFNLEVTPGEKIAIFPHTSTGKSTLAKVLAGLYTPTAGIIRYNGVDLRDLDMESINTCRGLILSSPMTLFEGTLEENITMGRSQIHYEDVLWALRFVEMEEEVDILPLGLKTPIRSGGRAFPTSQILRILIARAIVIRPQLLICEGTLHNMEQVTREVILRRLCSKEEPWSVIFISNDPTLEAHVDRRILLD